MGRGGGLGEDALFALFFRFFFFVVFFFVVVVFYTFCTRLQGWYATSIW